MSKAKMTCNRCGAVWTFDGPLSDMMKAANESGWLQLLGHPFFARSRRHHVLIGDFCPDCLAAIRSELSDYTLKLDIVTERRAGKGSE